jgi:hypothetical protein
MVGGLAAGGHLVDLHHLTDVFARVFAGDSTGDGLRDFARGELLLDFEQRAVLADVGLELAAVVAKLVVVDDLAVFLLPLERRDLRAREAAFDGRTNRLGCLRRIELLGVVGVFRSASGAEKKRERGEHGSAERRKGLAHADLVRWGLRRLRSESVPSPQASATRRGGEPTKARRHDR